MVTVSCPNEGCNESVIKSQLDSHVQNCLYSVNTKVQWNKQDISNSHSLAAQGKSSTQNCQFAFLGCQFVGNDAELAKHMEKDMRPLRLCVQDFIK